MHARGEGPTSSSALQALSSGAPLSDSFFYSYLDQLDEDPRSLKRTAGSPVQPGDSGSENQSDGEMMLPRREQHIRVSSDRLSPAQFVLQPGGRVVIAVAQGGPQQAFSIGRDVEEAFVTPVIPPGSSYEWTPPEPGRYFVQSEIYPHLRSAVVVLQDEAREEVTSVPPPGASRRNSSTLGSSARSSLSGELSGGVACTSNSGMASAAVDEYVSFPALGSVRTAATHSRATQTGSGGSFGSVSRQTSTAGMSSRSAAAAAAPSAVMRRYALPAGDEADAEGASLLDSPPASSLRQRRPRSTSAPTASAAAAAAAKQQTVQSSGALPPLGNRSASTGLPRADTFSVLSAGSGGSPRSGSGSERSAGSTTLYVRRDKYGGMLQTTHAFASGRSVYSDSRSDGGSKETQPLLYDSRRGSGNLQATSFSSSGSYRPYPTAAPPPHARQPAEVDRAPKLHKCPRCRKEYLSTINQRRCISSHLRGGGSAPRGGSIPDSSQLAAFWDGLEEGEKCAVMDLRTEHNGEHLMRQLEIQKLHRQRSGAMDQLTQEQKRLHASGMLLHSACGGRSGAAGAPAAIQSLTGAHLMRVLSEVSEGTFLFDRNPISQDEFSTGNNLEAGLGALVMKRLADAHLAAKQREADRLQRELEDQEAAQEALKAGKQQQAGAGGSQQQQAGGSKKKLKAKAKGRTAAPALPKPASTAAAVVAAAAAAAVDGNPALEVENVAAVPAPDPAVQINAQSAAQEQSVGASNALSPPRPSGEERYGTSPDSRKASAPGSSSSFTNFLFAEEAGGEAAAAAAAERAAEAGGWRTAGSARASGPVQHGPRSAPARRQQQPAVTKNTASTGNRSGGSGVSRLPDRPGLRVASSRLATAAQAAPAAPAKPGAAASATTNGKLPLATGSRKSAAVTTAPKPLGGKEQQAPPQRSGFPALPTAAPAKATAAAAAPVSSSGASVSYAAAAKAQQEGSNATAASEQRQEKQLAKAEADGSGRQQQQQQEQRAPNAKLGIAQQPKSWPVPGSTAALPPASMPSSNAALPRLEQQTQQTQQTQPAPPLVGQQAPTAIEAAPAAEGRGPAALQEAPAPAAEQSGDGTAPAPADVAGGAEEAQRCASVTPPISDAGSPPPGGMMPPPGYPPGYPCWLVGPDGGPLPPPHFYWVPHPPPGMQYGVDPAEGGMPPGAYPYPLYPPMPYPGMPPGHPASMPMPPPHMLPYPGDGQLAPFPQGMPVPLPPEVAEELAAVAAAAEGQPAGGWPAAASPDMLAEPAEVEMEAHLEAPTDGSSEQLGPKPQQYQQAREPAVVAQLQHDGKQPCSTGSRKGGFVAMLQKACGAQDPTPEALAAQDAAAEGDRRHRGPAAAASFDAAAAAAELERRWQAAAAQSVPASSLAVPRPPAAAPPPCPNPRSSSGGVLGPGSKPGKPSVGKAGSGRASPAGSSKPVVVAVRAFTSDDSAGGDGQGPKWRISTAPPAARQQQQQQQQQHAPARSVHAGSR